MPTSTSAAVSARVPAPVPKPAGITAQWQSGNWIHLTWDPVAGADFYEHEYAYGSGRLNEPKSGLFAVAPGTTEWCKIRNVVGGAESGWVTVTVNDKGTILAIDNGDPDPPPPDGPTTPTRFRVTATGPTTLGLAWEASSSPVGIRHYELTWQREGGSLHGTPVTGTSHTVTGLTPATGYDFGVYAVDNGGQESSVAITAGRTEPDGPPPPPPSGGYPPSAPFVDAMGWPTPRLRKWFRQWKVRGFFLGFWTPRREPDGSWRLTWGGYDRAVDKYEPIPDTECLSAGGTVHSHLAASTGYLKWLTTDIQAAGGTIIPSVGGANGHPLEQHPEVTIDEAVSEYIAALDNYGTRFIDFDIEGGALTTAEQQRRHVQVLLEIRRRRPDIKISHTFAVDIDGYNHHTRALVAEMAGQGYIPDMIMGMLMEMRVAQSGSYYDSLILGAEWMARHHREVFGWSEQESWRRLGLCPMFGANNGVSSDARKVTTIQDMRRLVEFAKQKGVATVSGWSANRDYHAHNPDQACEDTPNCPPGPPYPSIYNCTHVDQAHAEFSKLAAGYTRQRRKWPDPPPDPDCCCPNVNVEVNVVVNGEKR